MTIAKDFHAQEHGRHPFQNEPPRDYSLEASRARMRAALDEARRSTPVTCPVRIDGIAHESPREIVSVNPAGPDEVVARAGCATEEDADLAINSAKRGFADWGGRSARERADIVRRAAAWMRERRDFLAACEVLEAAKPWKEADADVVEAIDFLDYYAAEAVRLRRPLQLQPRIPGEENLYGYDPIGVAAVISPWNFPLAIPAGMVAAALVAGNTVCYKPAEQTPWIGWLLCRAFLESGVPGEALQFLPGYGEEVGAALVRHPDLALIAFTGSREVGFEILREAAVVRDGQRMIKRVVCELGGKNALIIDSTADLDAAVPDILYSAFGYSGQKCSALSRLIVLEPIYDSLMERLTAAAESLRIGSPEDPGIDLGPVIDSDAVRKIEGYIESGRKTARAAFAGDVSNLREDGGYFVAPHIFTYVDSNDPLATEEIFGPVLAVMKVKSLDEAIALANAVPFGLTGGIHSRTPSHVRRACREMRVGNFYVNRHITGAIVFRQPFGGFGHSGVGSKAGGPDYLKQFLLARAWSENVMRHGYAPLPTDEG